MKNARKIADDRADFDVALNVVNMFEKNTGNTA